MTSRRAFTLIEMLLVVAILSLLIAILLPNLNWVRGSAQEVQCKEKMRQIGDAFMMFALSNGMTLPAASHGGWEGTDAWQKCWIGKEGRVPGAFEPATEGPLATYLGGGGGGTSAFYRCPSLSVTPRNGGGSNGGFDYTMMLSFTGARVRSVPLEARVIYMSDPFSPPINNLRTPLLVEEDPSYHCNGLSIEPGFGSIDRMSSHHVSRATSYVAMDGGVETLQHKNPRPPQAWEWFVTSHRGVEVRLNNSVPYGSWKTQ